MENGGLREVSNLEYAFAMRMLSIEQVRARLRKMTDADHQAIARRTGVGYSTIRKIAYGITMNPRVDTFQRLARAVA